MADTGLDPIPFELGTEMSLPLDRVRRNPNQPRKFFKRESLEAMAKTIKKNGGVEEAIRVTPRDGGRWFMIIDGERRYRATKIAELAEISCIIKPEMSDRAVKSKSILANFCREDMTLAESAVAIDELMRENSWSQAQVAEEIGRTPGFVTNALKVLKLHPDLLLELTMGKIEPSIAVRLASYPQSQQKQLLHSATADLGGAVKGVHPNKVVRSLAKVAEKGGVAPIKPSRGRGSLPHAELVVRAASRAFIDTNSEIRQLLKVDKESMGRAQGESIQAMLTEARTTARLLEMFFERFGPKVVQPRVPQEEGSGKGETRQGGGS